METTQKRKRTRRHLSSFQIIIMGFAAAILVGSLLLMLPIATIDRQGACFEDALFTATSAMCVTGLVVQDTATYWSYFGQAVIIGLIQVGGLGVITLAMAITTISGRKIGIMQRNTMQEAISAPRMGGIVRLTGFILKVTACTELICAAIMFPVFYREFGLGKGIWYSIFHSISAFCNAGFDLMGVRGEFSSLTTFVGQPVINITIMFLIVFGGIGFLTWDDIRRNRFHFRRYRMQTKVIFLVTAILIVLPAIWMYFHEYAQASMTQGERVLASFFQSATLRTAGFNTTDLTAVSEPGQALMTLLMLIGGSPGSTAGGMKTTTIAVLIACTISVFRRREDTRLLNRRIDTDTVKNAATIFLMYMCLFFFSAFAISALEDIPLLECLFETASAVGTVGLTLGITTELGTVSHIILVLLMYLGRVGGLTLVFAAVSNTYKKHSKYPKEEITVG